MFIFFLCLFLGLLIGQFGVFSVHRARITKHLTRRCSEPLAAPRSRFR
jgi:hypothetical protein